MNGKNIKTAALAVLCGALGCSPAADMQYRPAAQMLPQNIRSIAIRPFANKTQQFGLEDKFTLRVIDEFLRRGVYPIVPEREADGVIVGEMSRYILLPVQYDANLVPTAYKLIVIINFRFLDAKKNIYLWEENNLEGIQTYAASTLPGGMKEEEAREAIWDVMARDIATRTYEGFGSVSGASQRKILATDVAPSTAPAKSPAGR